MPGFEYISNLFYYSPQTILDDIFIPKPNDSFILIDYYDILSNLSYLIPIPLSTTVSR